MSKNDGRHGTLEEDLERCMSRGKRSTRDMLIRDIRRWALISRERLHFGASDLTFPKMTLGLGDRCSTSYDLASLFRGRRSTLDR